MDASWALIGGKGKTIRFVGERVDNGEKLSFYLTINEDKFKVDEALIQSEGKIVTDGSLSVRGLTKLTAASSDEGGKVEGEFEGEIMELKGVDGGKTKPNSKGK